MSNYQRIYDDGIVWAGNTGTLVVRYETNAVEVGQQGLGLRFIMMAHLWQSLIRMLMLMER